MKKNLYGKKQVRKYFMENLFVSIHITLMAKLYKN